MPLPYAPSALNLLPVSVRLILQAVFFLLLGCNEGLSVSLKFIIWQALKLIEKIRKECFNS